MRSWILSLFASLLAITVGAQTTSVQPTLTPGFLDKVDEIRVHLGPVPRRLGDLVGKITVTVDGISVPVSGLSVGELAAPPPDPNRVTLPGSFQKLLGGSDWDPAGSSTQMAQIREGVYEFLTRLPKGRYEYKIARGGSWNENYGAGFVPGGPNFVLTVEHEQNVRFLVDFNEKWARNSVANPSLVEAPASIPTPPTVPVADRMVQSVRVKLTKRVTDVGVTTPIKIRVEGEVERPVYPREVLSHPDFVYKGSDLGAKFSERSTTFKVWSPVSRRASILLFADDRTPAFSVIPMRRGNKGVWYATVPGGLHGVYYQYKFESLGQTRFAADIYGVSASADSTRSMVINMARMNPAGWPAKHPFQGKPTDAIVYETHIRDFSIDAESGVKPEWRGKYLAFIQKNTRVPGAQFATGTAYLKSLGITHVHFLPFQDFNPAHSKGYNWGYETTLFNVPEEQYTVNPRDSIGRIRQCKAMIAALQNAGIGVILDVVYNHSVPSVGAGSAFWQTVPWYYFRTNDRGEILNESGVGNALNDERPMVRKFIRDSLTFWAKEYRLDGFRFDLMGMFTAESNIEFAKAIRSVNPKALIYGEPWTGGGPLRFGKGDQKGTGIAVFNDDFRNTFRGELDGPGLGFATGGTTSFDAVIRAMSGSIDGFASSPQETVNYVSAHDNYTFADKVSASLLASTDVLRERAVRFAHVAVLTSQGIPFLEGGVEIGRTKGMDSNSYGGGDLVNQYDWVRATKFRERLEYFRGLITLRKKNSGLRLRTAEEVRRDLTFTDPARLPKNVVMGRIAQPEGALVIVLNGNAGAQSVNLPAGTWSVLVNEQRASAQPIGTAAGRVSIPALSALVLQEIKR